MSNFVVPDCDIMLLPCPLTDKEKIHMGAVLAKAEVQLQEIMQTKKEQNKTYNEEMALLHDKIVELSQVLDSGIEDRDVEVKYQYDFAKNEKYIIRIDTGEIVDTIAPIPANERQGALKLETG